MGMYTEFHFRVKVKDGSVADWLEQQIVGEQWFDEPYDDHEFFTLARWRHVFFAGGAVYQYSARGTFRRATASYEDNWLALSSSFKNYGSEIEAFIDWITPHLDHYRGEFLGYSLYEDSRPVECWGRTVEDDREQPKLYFMGIKDD